MLCVFREALLRSLQVATLLVFSHRQAIEQCTEQILAFLYLSIRNKQDQSVFSIIIMASQSSESYPHFGTLATHAGQEPEQWKSLAVVPPISLSTTFKQLTPGQPVSSTLHQISSTLVWRGVAPTKLLKFNWMHAVIKSREWPHKTENLIECSF